MRVIVVEIAIHLFFNTFSPLIHVSFVLVCMLYVDAMTRHSVRHSHTLYRWSLNTTTTKNEGVILQTATITRLFVFSRRGERFERSH